MTRQTIGLLSQLIATAEKIINRQTAQVGTSVQLAELKPAIEAAAAAPVEGERFVGSEARVLTQALDQLERARRYRDEARAMRWAIIAGALLPMVRADMGRALEASRQPIPTTDR